MVNLEEEAYNQFAQIFGPKLRAFFIRRGLTEIEAEDLAGSCVTDIALKVRKYRQVTEGGFRGWVFTLAHHALADWHRTHQPTEELSDDVPAPLEDDRASENLTIVLAVEEALSEFSELDRSLLLLRNLQEKGTYAAFGELYGMTEGAVRVRHFRAKKQLKAILERDPRLKEYLSNIKRPKKNE
jgi:RNA polymerase sigma-70 factor (ECF subfamily)